MPTPVSAPVQQTQNVQTVQAAAASPYGYSPNPFQPQQSVNPLNYSPAPNVSTPSGPGFISGSLHVNTPNAKVILESGNWSGGGGGSTPSVSPATPTNLTVGNEPSQTSQISQTSQTSSQPYKVANPITSAELYKGTYTPQSSGFIYDVTPFTTGKGAYGASNFPNKVTPSSLQSQQSSSFDLFGGGDINPYTNLPYGSGPQSPSYGKGVDTSVNIFGANIPGTMASSGNPIFAGLELPYQKTYGPYKAPTESEKLTNILSPEMFGYGSMNAPEKNIPAYAGFAITSVVQGIGAGTKGLFDFGAETIKNPLAAPGSFVTGILDIPFSTARNIGERGVVGGLGYTGGSFVPSTAIGGGVGELGTGLKNSLVDTIFPKKANLEYIDLRGTGAEPGKISYSPGFTSQQRTVPNLKDISASLTDVKAVQTSGLTVDSGNILNFDISGLAKFTAGGKGFEIPIKAQSELRTIDILGFGKEPIKAAKITTRAGTQIKGMDIFSLIRGVAVEDQGVSALFSGKSVSGKGSISEFVGSVQSQPTKTFESATGKRIYSQDVGISFGKSGQESFNNLFAGKSEVDLFKDIRKSADSFYSSGNVKLSGRGTKGNILGQAQLSGVVESLKPFVSDIFGTTKPVKEVFPVSTEPTSPIKAIINYPQSTRTILFPVINEAPNVVQRYDSSNLFYGRTIPQAKQRSILEESVFGTMKQSPRSGYDLIQLQLGGLDLSTRSRTNQITSSLSISETGQRQKVIPEFRTETITGTKVRPFESFTFPKEPFQMFTAKGKTSQDPLSRILGTPKKRKGLPKFYEPSLTSIGFNEVITTKKTPRSASAFGVRPVVIPGSSRRIRMPKAVNVNSGYNYRMDRNLPKVMRNKNAAGVLNDTIVYLGGKGNKGLNVLQGVTKSPFGSGRKSKKQGKGKRRDISSWL